MSKIIFIVFLLTLSACQPGKSGSFFSPIASKSSAAKEAQISYESGDFQKAEQQYSSLVKSYPKNAEYLLGLANTKRRLGDYDGANAEYEKLLWLNPQNVDALEGRGLILLEKGDNQKAIDQLTKVLEVDAVRWKSINALGVAFAAQNNHKLAVDYYTDALSLSDSNHSPVILNNLALSHAFLGDYRKAGELLNKALTQLSGGVSGSDKEKFKKTELNLSLVYGIQGRTDEAERILRKYFSEPQVYNNLGIYAHLANDNDLARSYINKAISSSPATYESAWDTLKRIEPLVSKE